MPVAKARLGQQYKCVITTADGGRVETEPVKVCEPPTVTLTVTANPNSFVVLKGQPIQLGTAAKAEPVDGGSADVEISYQWYRDDAAIEGATDSELVLLSVEPEDAGTYYCVVSAGNVTAVSRTGTVDVIELEEPDEADEA